MECTSHDRTRRAGATDEQRAKRTNEHSLPLQNHGKKGGDQGRGMDCEPMSMRRDSGKRFPVVKGLKGKDLGKRP